jgi:Cu(I)/Ag(I) efflux system membrane fusion protein
MTTENTTPPASRRYGLGVLLLAALASAGIATGGTLYILSRGHDHAGHGAATAVAPEGGGEAAARYQCPMHPTIVQDHPGDCPICGMKLVKVGGGGAGASAAPSGGGGSATAASWQCPMHPSIVQDHEGDCPICGMKLVKVAGTGGGGGSGPTPSGMAAVTIDANRQQLIGMRIAHAERGVVGGAWRTSGRVAVDETRVHHVNVKFSGFMEHVHGDFIGRTVKRGEPLFSIYSPDLLAAQEEYALALRTRATLAKGGMDADGEALVRAARRKLELWDVPRYQLDRLEQGGEPSRTITFYSPATGVLTKKDVVPGMKVAAGDMPFEIVDLGSVWVLADAYETDLRHVKVGMKASLSLKAFPDRTFQGRVAFIDPMLDPKTRTAKVRLSFPNRDGDLKPEMFGEVVLHKGEREGLRVPADAVIDSGTRSVVFVALGEGRFEPREVKLGERSPEFVEVVSGLEKGDGVVTRANFLVDSESRLRASLDALAAGPQAAPAAPAAEGGAGGAPADPHAGHAR